MPLESNNSSHAHEVFLVQLYSYVRQHHGPVYGIVTANRGLLVLYGRSAPRPIQEPAKKCHRLCRIDLQTWRLLPVRRGVIRTSGSGVTTYCLRLPVMLPSAMSVALGTDKQHAVLRRTVADGMATHGL